MPTYSKEQCNDIASALILCAEYHEADDERTTLVLDLEQFLNRALYGNDQAAPARPDLVDADEPRNAYFRAVNDFRTLNQKRSGHPSEACFPLPMFWRAESGDVELWIGRGGLATFLRAQRNWVGGTELRQLLASLNWR